MSDHHTAGEAVELSVAPSAAGPELLLRPWRAEDADPVLNAFQDPVIRRWLVTSIGSAAEAREWLDAQAAQRFEGTAFSFAVTEAEDTTSRPLGNVVLKLVAPGGTGAEVGYWIAPEARGRGLASRALGAVAEWAFTLRAGDGSPLDRLELFHSVGNDGSCRVAEKSGFPLEAQLPPFPPDFPNDGHLHSRTRLRADDRA